MRWRASGTYSLSGNRRTSSWNVVNDFSVSFGGRTDKSTLNNRSRTFGAWSKQHAALHVEAVVDPRMGRVLALELLGRVDRGLGLLALVVEINEVELRLARLGAERVARLERHEILDRARVVRRVHGVLALHVEELGAGVLDRVVAPAAARGGGREARGEQDHSGNSKHVRPVRAPFPKHNEGNSCGGRPAWTMKYSRKFPNPRAGAWNASSAG